MKGKGTFKQAEAEQIIILIAEKQKANVTEQKSIRNKIRKLGFYASDFGISGGYTVNDFLNFTSINSSSVNNAVPTNSIKNKSSVINQKTGKRGDSDEAYIIGICDEILKETAIKQHRFDFLRGDSGIMLPVDAYYRKPNIVIEYMEKQHSEPVKFFDKKQTVSGVGRGEQRKIYDERKRILIPENGINFIIFDYEEFEHANSKRLVRNFNEDAKIILNKLKPHLK